MKKSNRTYSFLLGMLTMALLVGLVIPGVAASTQKAISVSSGVTIFVDGVEMKPTDVNGNPVETFLYNGTTYVPLRAVSQYLGKAVNWDGSNRRVYIGEVPGQGQYLWDVCPPYQSGGSYEHGIIENVIIAGKTYRKGYVVGSNGFAWFNLNGKYSTLSFDIGHRDDRGIYNAELKIYLDDELEYSLNLKPDMMPQHITLPLHGALQMKIVTDFHGDHYGIVNAEIK